MIDLHGVRKVYDGRVAALDGVSLHVPDGGFCLLLGPTGAGKTTLLRLLWGTQSPDAGRIAVYGREFAALPVSSRQALRRHMGCVLGDVPLLERWTVYDHLAVMLEIAGGAPGGHKHRVWQVLKRVGLRHRVYDRAGDLSAGERQCLAFGRAIVHDPDVLLLDDPVNSLDPRAVRLILSLLGNLHERGMTIVLATHALVDEFPAGQTVYLRQGRVVETGT